MTWTGIARQEHSRKGLRYSSDMTDREWSLAEPFIPPAKRGGRRRTTDMREVVNALLYIAASGCAWRLLPKCFPPVSTVQRYFYAWRNTGLLEAMNTVLVMNLREIEGREASPSAGVIDSQSVKTTESGGPCGYDAGKKLKGRKRHILTDTCGFLIFILVHTADIQDRDGAVDVLKAVRKRFPWRNPKLIYCAVSGFGQDGPWRDRPAYDQIVQGLSGAMSVTGDAQTAPLRAGFPMADTIGGLNAAVAISAALVRQQTSGAGETIDVSMLESTMAAMGWVVSNHLNGGIDPQPIGNQNFTAAPSGTFSTADGPINIAANEQRQFEALCDLLDRPALKTDARFAKRQARKDNRGALNMEVEAALASDTAKAWEDRLNAAGVPCGRVLSVPEILREPQVTTRDFVRTIGGETSSGSPLRVTRPGFSLSTPFPEPALPPKLGADTARWMEEIGMAQEVKTA